jgi:hypothetical protein
MHRCGIGLEPPQRTARRLSERFNGRLLNETLLRSLPHARVGAASSAVDRWDAAAEEPMVRRLTAGGNGIRTAGAAWG